MLTRSLASVVAGALLVMGCDAHVVDSRGHLAGEGGPSSSADRCGAAPGGVQVLVHGQMGPNYVAVDAANIYWAEAQTGGDALWSMAKTGGTPVKLAPGMLTYGIAVDDAYVFWALYEQPELAFFGAISRAPKAGGAPEMLVDDAMRPTDVALDVQYVYWLDTGTLAAGYIDGHVRRVAKDGTNAAVLTGEQVNLNSLAVSETHAFFAGNGDLRRVPLSGGATSVLFEPEDDELEVTAVAVDAGAVYFALTRVSALIPSSVWRANLDGSDAHVAYSGCPYVTTIAVDEHCLYCGGPSSIARAPKNGGSAVELAKDVAPDHIRLDDDAVFWAEHDRVVRLPE